MRTVAGVFVTLSLLAVVPRDASACVCVILPGSCSAFEEGDAMLEATVVAIERREHPSPQPNVMLQERVIHLADVRAWRGRPAEVVFTGGGGGDCGYEFIVGTRYMIHGSRHKGDGQLWTGSCSKTRPLRWARGVRDYLQGLSNPTQGGHVFGRVVSGARHRETDAEPRPEVEPVVGARVFVMGPIRTSITSGPDGQFSVAALPSGDYTVSVTFPPDRRDLLNVEPRSVRLDGPRTCAEVDFDMPYASLVEGTVVDREGAPMPDVFVALMPARSVAGDGGGRGVDTGPDGRYQFSNIPPGRYVVGLSLMGGPNGFTPFAVAYGRSHTGGIELAVPESGGTIGVQPLATERLSPIGLTGAVTWSDGQPAAGLDIGALVVGERGPVGRVFPVRTAGDGSFALQGMYAGAPYRLVVRRAGRILYESDIIADEAPMIIEVPVP